MYACMHNYPQTFNPTQNTIGTTKLFIDISDSYGYSNKLQSLCLTQHQLFINTLYSCICIQLRYISKQLFLPISSKKKQNDWQVV